MFVGRKLISVVTMNSQLVVWTQTSITKNVHKYSYAYAAKFPLKNIFGSRAVYEWPSWLNSKSWKIVQHSDWKHCDFSYSYLHSHHQRIADWNKSKTRYNNWMNILTLLWTNEYIYKKRMIKPQFKESNRTKIKVDWLIGMSNTYTHAHTP